MASYHKKSTIKNGEIWVCRFRIIENGKEVQKTLSPFPTKKKAQAAYTAFMASYIPETKRDSAQLTFAQIYGQYKLYIKDRLKESSCIDTCGRIENHILPTFGNMPIEKISPRDIVEWQSKCLTNMSFNYKKSIRTALSAIFNFAVRYYDLLLNPVQRVEPLRNSEPKREMLYWTYDEFKQFIDSVDDVVYHTFFAFLYFTGARKGEALALTWDDLNLEEGTVKINKSVTNKTTDKSYAITTTKNQSSTRTIVIGTPLIEMLTTFKKWQSENFDDTGFVFCGDRPLPTTSIDTALSEYCKIAKVKKIRIHDFRHSHCSYLISHGISIVAVAKRLGHSDTQQTLNTYAHMMPSDDTAILNLLNDDK